jgi:hypothetical protein
MGADEAAARTAAPDWTPAEVKAVVEDYFDMLDAELRGETFNKAGHRRALLAQLRARSKAAVEFKRRNISAILSQSGLPYMAGYKPAANYQDALADAVTDFLALQPDWKGRAELVVPAAPPSAERCGIEDIFVPPPEPAAASGTRSRPIIASTRDYAAAHAANSKLGKAGETFVLDLERRFLREHGRDDLAARVEHVSETQGDGLGYDILSFDVAGKEKWIEVKTTNLGPRTPFYVSANEATTSCSEPRRYWLYRLYQFSRVPRLFRLQGAIGNACHLEPSVFLARVTVPE